MYSSLIKGHLRTTQRKCSFVQAVYLQFKLKIFKFWKLLKRNLVNVFQTIDPGWLRNMNNFFRDLISCRKRFHQHKYWWLSYSGFNIIPLISLSFFKMKILRTSLQTMHTKGLRGILGDHRTLNLKKIHLEAWSL